jgi:membrane-associated protease RseP (regulator of RpoE activity)
MLALVLVPVLLGVSMLAQRPVSRWLGVKSVRPLLPFAREVPGLHRLAIRGAGVLFTLVLVLLTLFLQARREQHLSPRVEVAPGLAAAEAGLLTGDLITAVDGVPVSDFAGIRDELLQGAQKKKLTLVRGEQQLELTVTLRDGLLGVKSLGEAQETDSSEALRVALGRFFYTPWLVLRLPGGLSTGVGPKSWLLALSVTLTISWWLMLLVELAALTLAELRALRNAPGP